MRKLLVLTAALGVAAAVVAPAASAGTTRCYTFHATLPVVGPLNTTEQCINLPDVGVR